MSVFQSIQTPARGNSILGLVFTDNFDLIHTYESGEPLANSDHNMVRIRVNFHIKTRGNVFLLCT